MIFILSLLDTEFDQLLLVLLLIGITYSIWDTPGRSLRDDSSGGDHFVWYLIGGLLLTTVVGWLAVKSLVPDDNQQDPARLIQQAINLSREGLSYVNDNGRESRFWWLMVTSIRLSSTTTTVTTQQPPLSSLAYQELDNLISESSLVVSNLDQQTITDLEPTISYHQSAAAERTLSRFNYLNELVTFILGHPWLSFVGISVISLSGWYLYARYNSRKKFKSLVVRPLSLSFFLIGLLSVGGASYLYYKGFNYQFYKLISNLHDLYQSTCLSFGQIQTFATQGLSSIPPAPTDISEIGLFIFFRRKTKLAKFYFIVCFLVIITYFLNFFNESHLVTRYSESAKLSAEIYQKTLKLQKLAQIEQKDLDLFVQSIEQTPNEPLIKLAQVYSAQNKQTVDSSCRLVEKISQADQQMTKACQIIKSSNHFEANLGQRLVTFEEYLLDSFTSLVQLPRASFIILVFVILTLGLFFSGQFFNDSQQFSNKTLLAVEDQTSFSRSLNLLLFTFVGTIFFDLIFLFVTSYHLHQSFGKEDSFFQTILIGFALRIGDTFLGIGFLLCLFFLCISFRFFLLEIKILKKYHFTIGLTGIFLLFLFSFFQHLSLFKFCYFLFFFILLLF